ncbi:LytR/AlgR family response regulator transcription factor [Microbacter margulisiae]|uniref:DNA-binding LytR/AlgR family response regulator n=1 Tax=Microbacter margulisiae TaxID=1350067 RepID=A0A7W5H1H6_9PORP|nr:LytTR family DNA-binding domain-containing protein [Microbacter margulisiae]MBB3186377.1 DNA-binding LytR/AlgR family response regulator [Microbacter margulisiae]
MMNCIAVDDEKYSLELIADNIRRTPFLHLTATCNSSPEAIRLLETEPIDLVFLDIQMPMINGLQLLRRLDKKPMVIIVSAYKNYALESFELDVLDYLLKPVTYERFSKAALKANDYYHLTHKQDKSNAGYIFVNADYRLVKIELDKVLYVEGMKDYVKIFLSDARRPIVPKLSLKAIGEMLPEGTFMRIHKSYIINTDKIIALQRQKLTLSGDHTLPIGQNYRESYEHLFAKDEYKS